MHNSLTVHVNSTQLRSAGSAYGTNQPVRYRSFQESSIHINRCNKTKKYCHFSIYSYEVYSEPHSSMSRCARCNTPIRGLVYARNDLRVTLVIDEREER